jgi:hypothetical protein
MILNRDDEINITDRELRFGSALYGISLVNNNLVVGESESLGFHTPITSVTKTEKCD